MDIFVTARNELQRQLLAMPPPSYQSRLIAQMVLGGLLTCQCMAYLFIWVRDARRAGRSLALVHIQRTDGGPMLTVQALCVYVMCSLFAGACFLGYRYQVYTSYYYENAIVQNAAITELSALSFTVYANLGYTFSNFNSTILLLRSSNSVESTGRRWVIFYNSLFAAAILAWLAAIIPIGVAYNPERDLLYVVSRKTLSLLDAIIADPNQLTPSNLGQLQEYQIILMEGGDKLLRALRKLTILGSVYSGVIALMNTYSLLFVYRLRKHVRDTRGMLNATPATITEDSGLTSSGQHVKFTSASGFGNTAPAHAAKTLTRPRREETALNRLIRDLTLSVPTVLLVTTYYPVAGAVAITHKDQTSWPWNEFRNEVFNWPSLLVPNIIVAYFLYNSWTAPGKYGITNDERTIISHPSFGSSRRGEFPRDGSYQLKTLHISAPCENAGIGLRPVCLDGKQEKENAKDIEIAGVRDR